MFSNMKLLLVSAFIIGFFNGKVTAETWAAADRTAQSSFAACRCPSESTFGVDVWEGEIKSPGYPGNYCSNLECRWTIDGRRDNTAIRLTIESFHTQAFHDHLDIMQKQDSETRILRKLSGTISNMGDFVSARGNGFVLNFVSDGSVEYRGFVLRFQRFNVTAEACDCGPMLYAAASRSNVIPSPNFPNPYCRNIVCFYIIEAPSIWSVRVEVTELDLEPSVDQLRIYEGETNNTVDANLLLTVSGTRSDHPTIISKTQSLVIVFSSAGDTNQLSNHRGFTIAYWQANSPCGWPTELTITEKTYITSPTFPETYCNNLDFRYKIQTAQRSPSSSTQTVLLFEFVSLDLEPRADWLFLMGQNGGKKRWGRTVAQYTGKKISGVRGKFTMNKNKATLWLKTDSSVVAQGFNLSVTPLQRHRDCMCPTPQPREYSAQSAVIRFNPSSTGTNCGYLDCLWTINPPSRRRHKLLLNINTRTHNHNETLRVINGVMGQSAEAESQTFRGTITSRFHSMSASGSVTLHYHSFYSGISGVDGRGFTVQYEWKEGCFCGDMHRQATAKRAILTSPKYPLHYCDSLRCLWVLTAPVNHRVVFHITDFQTEAGADRVFLFDGDKTPGGGNTTRISSYTGPLRSAALRKTTKSRKMSVQMITDSSITYKGFRAEYYSEPIRTHDDGTPPRRLHSQFFIGDGQDNNPNAVVTVGDDDARHG